MELLTPYVRYAADHTMEQNFFAERMLLDHELIYVKEGTMYITEEGKQYDCPPGSIIFFRPGRIHSFATRDNIVHQPHVHFDFFKRADSKSIQILTKLPVSISQQEQRRLKEAEQYSFTKEFPTVIRLKNPLVFEQKLMDLIREYDDHSPFREMMLQGSFICLWATLCREYEWSRSSVLPQHREEMEFIKQYLSNHAEEEVSLDELAAKVNLSKYHMLRIFKLFYHETPIQYHTRQRLTKARELVLYSMMPVNEIAERLGFASIHSFSRWFKNLTGVSPAFYRGRIK
jgi:AraC-like DNA-binding protein